MQRTAEIELSFLERTYDERWRFGVKPHPRFDQLLADLARTPGLFQFKSIQYMPGSGLMSRGKAYEVNEDGMWFLSHLFSNWEEMRARYGHIRHEGETRTEEPFTYTFTFTTANTRADDIGEILRRFRMGYGGWQSTSSTTSPPRYRPTLPQEAREAFSLLDIEPGATESDIARAYKAKALVAHPDRGGLHTDMVALNKAREVALKYASEG